METWYSSNLASFTNQLADTIWCNDKSIDTKYPYGPSYGFGGYQTGYSTRGRLEANNTAATNAAPVLKCQKDSSGGKLSKFTVTDIINGNGNLTYKIGLLTADEVAYSGGMYNISSTNYYLNQNASSDYWWTLSPYYVDAGCSAYAWGVGSTGFLYGNNVDALLGLRPAISLISTTLVTGEGTSTNPYQVEV